MKVVFSDGHRAHFAQGEIFGGEFVTPFERPSRMEYILRELRRRHMDHIIPPEPLEIRRLGRVHDAGFLEFLEHAWTEWVAAGFRGEILPTSIPNRSLRQRRPQAIDGRVGYYIHSLETCITAGTWEAACCSASVALTGARLISEGERSAFALCRPPGHHAHDDLYGGYCFLNNAAIAAQAVIDNGALRLAILDVDFHHGNGTQDIFYERPDVLFCSLHGEPQTAYPYFLGYADERGAGAGEGFNHNYPLPAGTDFLGWSAALASALQRIKQYGPEVLIVSLGVDTYEKDPISYFKLKSPDFSTYGGMIAGLGLPTLFVMEGGYAIEEIGLNTVNVLQGFLEV